MDKGLSNDTDGLALAGNWRSRFVLPGRSRTGLLATLIFIVGLLLTGIVTRTLLLSENERAAAEMETVRGRVVDGLYDELSDLSRILRGEAGLFAASGRVSHAQWLRYLARQGLETDIRGYHAIGYAPRLRSPGHGLVSAGQGADAVGIWPAGRRAEYFPLLYVSPELPELLNVRGFDMASEIVRRDALFAARDLDKVVMTGLVTLKTRSESMHSGLALFQPVYRQGAPIATEAERRDAFEGVVFFVFRTDQMLEPLLAQNAGGLGVRIDDVTDGSEQRIAEAGPRGGRRVDSASLHFAGRAWQITFFHGDEALEPYPASRVAAISGWLMSMLVALLFWHLGTQRFRAQEEARRMTSGLRDSETRLRDYQSYLHGLIDELPLPLVVKDPEHRVVLANRAYAQLVGDAVPAIIGRRADELFGPAVAGSIEEIERQAWFAREEISQEVDYLDRDGKPRSMLVKNVVFPGPDGMPQFLGIHTDLTEFKNKENALRAADATHRSILEALPDMLFQLDERMRVVSYHAYQQSDLAMPPSAFLGRPLEQSLSPTMARRFRETAMRVMAGEGLQILEYTVRDDQGERQHYELRMVSIATGGALAVIRRVTEQKRAEEALRESEAELMLHRDHLAELVGEQTRDLLLAKEAAEAANEAKSAFLANMSHELRTPMHAILSFARLGRDRVESVPPPRLKGYFERIEVSGDRLLNLLNDLLDLSKIEAGKMPVDGRQVALQVLLREVSGEFSALYAARRVRIEVEAEAGLPGIWADPARIVQVARNLLSNAAKFSPEE
ncbi:MAG: PAS domain-containing protein, partial [Zoogloea sp.]|nr:PAS domain-containing protein [Zoogloea sp.]